MAKGVSKELEREIRNILEKFVAFPLGTEGYPRWTGSEPEREATEYLIDIGVFEALPDDTSSLPYFRENRRYDTIRLTAYGREYYERLTT